MTTSSLSGTVPTVAAWPTGPIVAFQMPALSKRSIRLVPPVPGSPSLSMTMTSPVESTARSCKWVKSLVPNVSGEPAR